MPTSIMVLNHFIMKKFIIKKIREDCYFDSAHPCCNSFINNKLFYLFIISSLLISSTFYGQLVGSSSVQANFGTEADVYANRLQFPNVDVPPIALPSAAGTDDWFVNQSLYPGTGKGVIDVSNAANLEALILSNNRNYPFEVRQSVTTPTIPFPFPIVDGFLWIDSVYGRDTQTGQGRQDSSRFDQTSDKNADNPSTWNLGIGDVPQKDDIIDVFAHLRGAGPKAPTAQDPRPFTNLWAFIGGSLRETNGSKHIDFEFFRTLVGYTLGASNFTNTGTDGGRTAWTFTDNGNIIIPGTVII